MQTKPWYRSKTIWFNALTIVTTIAAYFGWNPDQQITMNVAGFLVAASPIINLVLRLMTRKPIAPASSNPLR
jgi:hypothetical protein